MKKTFVKLGVLAVALALVFAACAQPTDEEEGSSAGHDTIFRLWVEDTLDTAGATVPQLAPGDEVVITLASATSNRWNHATRASTVYQSVFELRSSLGDTEPAATAAAEQAVSDLYDALETGADGALYLLARRSLTNADTFLTSETPLDIAANFTGRLQNVIGNGTVDETGAITAPYTIRQEDLTQTKEGKYIDLFLYDTTATRNQVWEKSGSYYVFLTKANAAAGTPGALPEGTYVYTKDATSRNQTEQEKPLSGLHRDRRYNGNVKKYSFKNGINEFHLQNFSK